MPSAFGPCLLCLQRLTARMHADHQWGHACPLPCFLCRLSIGGAIMGIIAVLPVLAGLGHASATILSPRCTWSATAPLLPPASWRRSAIPQNQMLCSSEGAAAAIPMDCACGQTLLATRPPLLWQPNYHCGTPPCTHELLMSGTLAPCPQMDAHRQQVERELDAPCGHRHRCDSSGGDRWRPNCLPAGLPALQGGRGRLKLFAPHCL